MKQRKKQIKDWISAKYNSIEEKLIILFHVKRIIKDIDISLYNKVNDEIKTIQFENNIDLDYFIKIDTITEVCDLASFLFCFGNEKNIGKILI